MSLLTERTVILASASPRRLDLLRQVDIEPRIVVAEVEELKQLSAGLSPQQLVQINAQRKAEAVYRQCRGEDAIIIAADTVVVHLGQLFGKPADEAEACRMLAALSGDKHSVFTGHYLIDAATGQAVGECSETQVQFAVLTAEEIAGYVASGEPLDKAGAYGMQSRGGLFVDSIYGDYSTVVGLSLPLLYRLIKKMAHQRQAYQDMSD